MLGWSNVNCFCNCGLTNFKANALCDTVSQLPPFAACSQIGIWFNLITFTNMDFENTDVKFYFTKQSLKKQQLLKIYNQNSNTSRVATTINPSLPGVTLYY